MKKKLLLFIMTIVFLGNINAQIQMPKSINDEFGQNVITSYRQGQNVAVLINKGLQEKGYRSTELRQIVESIIDNTKNRDEILDIFHDYLGSDREFLKLNLLSLNLSETGAEYLTDYIIEEKYKSREVLEEEAKQRERELEIKSQEQRNNPFGSGEGSGRGFGSGEFTGNGMGAAGSRTRLRNVTTTPKTPNSKPCSIAYKLIVDNRGKVIRADVRPQETTTNNQALIDEVTKLVKKEVLYKEKPGAHNEIIYYTITIKAN